MKILIYVLFIFILKGWGGCIYFKSFCLVFENFTWALYDKFNFRFRKRLKQHPQQSKRIQILIWCFSLESNEVKLLGIKIDNKFNSTIVGEVYRPPHVNVDTSILMFDELLNKCTKLTNDIIIRIDFNLNLLKINENNKIMEFINNNL